MQTLSQPKRILLISNSTLYGGGFLDHAEREIRDFLGEIGCVLFIPFALFDRDAYAAKTRERFNAMGYDLDSAHDVPDKRQGEVVHVRMHDIELVRTAESLGQVQERVWPGVAHGFIQTERLRGTRDQSS